MKDFAIILDRDLSDSPTCQIIASAASPEVLKKVVTYDPLGGYETIFKSTYQIQKIQSHTLRSEQNNQSMPAHICLVKR